MRIYLARLVHLDCTAMLLGDDFSADISRTEAPRLRDGSEDFILDLQSIW